jgi:Methyltransferase FkbM domain
MRKGSIYPDLTKYDIVKGYLKYGVLIARIYFDFLRLLTMRYSNYLSVGYQIKKKRFPISAVRRDGTQREYSTLQEIWFDLRNISLDIDKDIILISDIKLKGGTTNGDIFSIFINKDYESLPLKDRIVIDIGANIADSSVYFVRQGAKKVYAIEPNRALYELANENIHLNSMSDRIETIFAGCSSKTSRESNPPFLSLEEIVDYYKIAPDFLKVDCEGCEYDIILNSSDNILQSFNYIFVEYHYGFRKIKERLEKCGFRTKVSGPTYFPRINKPNSLTTRFSNNVSKVETDSLIKPFFGYVYASRNDPQSKSSNSKNVFVMINT